MEGKTYKEFQSEMCPASPDPTPAPSPPPTPSVVTISPGTAAAISVVAVISFMVFVLVIKNLIKKTSNAQGNPSDPGSNEEMRRNSKSTTLEESGTQAPVAVEPVNTGTLGESTREEEDEATIRLAFEIIEDHERNLARRLENVRR